MYVSHFLRSSEQIVIVRAQAIREAVTVYNRFIRSDVGGIEASDSATALFRSIVLTRKETTVPHSPHDLRAFVSLNGADTSGYAFQWVKRQRSRPTSLRAHDSRWIRICMEALLVAADFHHCEDSSR
jgi:hypothetical protein